jgi:hypothetical protein
MPMAQLHIMYPGKYITNHRGTDAMLAISVEYAVRESSHAKDATKLHASASIQHLSRTETL